MKSKHLKLRVGFLILFCVYFIPRIVKAGDDAFPSDSKKPTPSQAVILLRNICDKGIVVMKNDYSGGKKPGCAKVSRYPSGVCTDFAVESVIFGSFVSAHSQEAVIDYSGCEPHVNNFGGSALIRNTGIGWHPIFFSPGERIGSCLKFTKNDLTDTLTCHRFSWTRNWVKLGTGGRWHGEGNEGSGCSGRSGAKGQQSP